MTDNANIEELELYIPNDFAVYRYHQTINRNVEKKIQKGIFDKELAIKAYMYVVRFALKRYRDEFGWIPKLSKSDKEQIALGLANEYLIERIEMRIQKGIANEELEMKARMYVLAAGSR